MVTTVDSTALWGKKGRSPAKCSYHKTELNKTKTKLKGHRQLGEVTKRSITLTRVSQVLAYVQIHQIV